MTNLIVGSGGFIGNYFSKQSTATNTYTIANSKEFNTFLYTSPKTRFERVFWLAGQALPSMNYSGDPQKHPDFVSLRTFLQRYSDNFDSFIFLSSGGCIYKAGVEPFSEISELHPWNKYGEIKIQCEELIEKFTARRTILRVANVHHHSQMPGRGQGVLANWLDAVRTNRPIRVYGSMNNYRDYISLSDLSVALQALSYKEVFGIFNIGSGERLSLQQIVSALQEIYQKELDYIIEPSRVSDRQGYYLDNSKARKELNWQPSKDSLASVKETILEFQKKQVRNQL